MPKIEIGNDTGGYCETESCELREPSPPEKSPPKIYLTQPKFTYHDLLVLREVRRLWRLYIIFGAVPNPSPSLGT